MKLAINYSDIANNYFNDGAVKFDLYKCAPDFVDGIDFTNVHRPIYFHFPFTTGRDHPLGLNKERTIAFLKKAESKMINTHLAPLKLQSEERADSVEYYYTLAVDHLRELGSWVGSSNVILENIYWEEEFDIPDWATDAKNITKVLEDTNSSFLLDLSHARISAEYQGLKPEDYISSLPCHRLRELHLCGTAFPTGSAHRSDHYPIADSDRELIDWAFCQIATGKWRRPEIVALEHGGLGTGLLAERMNGAAIKEELNMLYSKIQLINKS
jgi:uncharacterized protein (UPF0276 family)